MSRSYVIPNRIWDQVGALSEVTEDFEGAMVSCSRGTITVNINNMSFSLAAGDILDEGVIKGETFSVVGTGTWKGFLRGFR